MKLRDIILKTLLILFIVGVALMIESGVVLYFSLQLGFTILWWGVVLFIFPGVLLMIEQKVIRDIRL